MLPMPFPIHTQPHIPGQLIRLSTHCAVPIVCVCVCPSVRKRPWTRWIAIGAMARFWDGDQKVYVHADVLHSLLGSLDRDDELV
jgi:hypothetical protein